MVDCFVLLNSGDFVLLNDGTSKVQMNSCFAPSQGGGSGGRVSKKVGHQLTDLGPRPHVTQNGESHARLVIRPTNKSKSRLSIRVRAESVCDIIPHFIGVSFSKVVLAASYESKSLLRQVQKGESWAVSHPSIIMEKVLKKTAGLRSTIKAMTYLNMLDSIDDMYKDNDRK